jgi:Ca2+-binding RTX toxin-like protein
MADIPGTDGDDFVHVSGDGEAPPAGANELALATSGADVIDLSGRGDDTVFAGGGRDVIAFTSRFNSRDEIDGGGGTDTLELDGDYSGGVNFRSHTIRKVEIMALGAGHDYELTTHSRSVDAGATLTVDAGNLNGGDFLIFDGSAETDGSFSVIGGRGDDAITGGAFADTLSGGAGDDRLFTNQFGVYQLEGGNGDDSLFAAGGTYEVIDAGSGDDLVFMHSTVNTADLVLSGGRGNDLLDIGSTVLGLAEFSAASSDFERLQADGFTISGLDQDLDWDFSGFELSPFSLGVRLSAQSGFDTLTGTALADTLFGGDGDDRLRGDLGSDRLFGEAGADRFICRSVEQSNGAGVDVLEDIDFQEDKLDLSVSVAAVAAGVEAELSAGTFEADLGDALGETQLPAANAVLVTADAGDLLGRTFLVVEAGGGAGYQAGEDLVFEIGAGASTNGLGAGDFI